MNVVTECYDNEPSIFSKVTVFTSNECVTGCVFIVPGTDKKNNLFCSTL